MIAIKRFLDRVASSILKVFGGSILDQFARHGLSDQSGTKLEQKLLREEFHAEVKISKIRLGMMAFLLITQIIRTLTHNLSFQSAVLPAMIAVLISSGFLMDYHLLRNKRHEKLFTRMTKYIVITGDVIGVQFLFYRILVKSGSQSFIEPGILFPMGMLLAGTIMILLNIYRINPATCVYNLILLGASFPLFQSAFISSGNIFLKQAAIPNYPVLQFYGTILITSLLAIVISRRMRTVLVRSKRQDQLERFLPEMVAQQVLSGNRDITAGGTRHTVTILFADIRNFTSYSEENTPEDVIDFLNAYFNDMISVIFKYNGTLDKIIGDGLMAIFGAPFPSEQDAENAVRTALDMQKKLRTFNELREMSGQQKIKIGIGIHTGEVILGNIGSHQRLDFTVIGDAVNTASRLEGLTKNKDAEIIISAATRSLLPKTFSVESLGSEMVKGKKEAVEIFSVLPEAGE